MRNLYDPKYPDGYVHVDEDGRRWSVIPADSIIALKFGHGNILIGDGDLGDVPAVGFGPRGDQVEEDLGAKFDAVTVMAFATENSLDAIIGILQELRPRVAAYESSHKEKE
jgi:hypothetical protein